jgi:hypothetical protein
MGGAEIWQGKAHALAESLFSSHFFPPQNLTQASQLFAK